MGFIFFEILAQNPNVLAFGFIKKASLRQKIDWNSVFIGLKDQILPLGFEVNLDIFENP